MTLHIGYVCNAFTLQVGDRLLSIDSGKSQRDAWDPFANKTIMIMCTDGRAVVSYAGLAHINSQPTDEWLFDAITLNAFGDAPEPFMPETRRGFRFGGPPLNLRLWDVVTRVKEAIERDLKRQYGVRGRDRQIEVLITGWATPRAVFRRGSRPTAFGMFISSEDLGRKPCTVETTARFRYADPAKQARMMSIGMKSSRDLGVELRKWMSGRAMVTAEEIEQQLVELVRFESDKSLGAIGRDLMVCYMPIRTRDQAHIRFYRDTSAASPLSAYSPAFVHTDSMYAPPSVLTGGGLSFVFGPDEDHEQEIPVECVPPLPKPDGPSRMSTQERLRF